MRGNGILKLLDCSSWQLAQFCDGGFEYTPDLEYILNFEAYPPRSGSFPSMPDLSRFDPPIPGSLDALSNIQTLDEIQASVKDSADAYEQQLQDAIDAANGEAADLRA